MKIIFKDLKPCQKQKILSQISPGTVISLKDNYFLVGKNKHNFVRMFNIETGDYFYMNECTEVNDVYDAEAVLRKVE